MYRITRKAGGRSASIVGVVLAVVAMTASPAGASASGTLSNGSGDQTHVPGPPGSDSPPCITYYQYQATLAYTAGNVTITDPVTGAVANYVGPAESTVTSDPGVSWGEGPPGTYDFCGGSGPGEQIGPPWGRGTVNGASSANGTARALNCTPDANSSGDYKRSGVFITVHLHNHTCTASEGLLTTATEPDTDITLTWEIKVLNVNGQPVSACNSPIAPETCVIENGQASFTG